MCAFIRTDVTQWSPCLLCNTIIDVVNKLYNFSWRQHFVHFFFIWVNDSQMKSCHVARHKVIIKHVADLKLS